MGSDLITNTTDANFSGDVLNSDVPFSDFWATWCGPCRPSHLCWTRWRATTKAPSICKVDVDHNQAIAGQFGVRNIPTLLLFKGGEVSDNALARSTAKRLTSLWPPRSSAPQPVMTPTHRWASLVWAQPAAARAALGVQSHRCPAHGGALRPFCRDHSNPVAWPMARSRPSSCASRQ